MLTGYERQEQGGSILTTPPKEETIHPLLSPNTAAFENLWRFRGCHAKKQKKKKKTTKTSINSIWAFTLCIQLYKLSNVLKHVWGLSIHYKSPREREEREEREKELRHRSTVFGITKKGGVCAESRQRWGKAWSSVSELQTCRNNKI